MIVDIKVPQLAESIAEATLLSWYKQEGEAVKRGENLIDIETDKVTLEVTAPHDGVLKEIVKQEGDQVGSEEIIARIDTNGAAHPAATASKGDGKSKPDDTTQEPVSESDGKAGTADKDKDKDKDKDEDLTATAGKPKTSPAVRRLLEEHRLDAGTIPVSRDDGRLTKEDVLSYLESRTDGQQEQAGEQARAAPAATRSPAPQVPAADDRPEERVPMTRLRRRIAERLLSAQREHAILTTFNEINTAPVMTLRRQYKEQFDQAHGVKLGLMSFFTKAAVEALKRYPMVNASIEGEDIIYHGYFDIGIAVGSSRGLVVPVIRDADQLSFAEIESAVRDFGDRAESGKLKLEELTGGTFTITNGGIFGSLMSTPIINPPQSAILGMHKIQERPVAEDGQVVIRPMMYVALSYDHRIIDGREAVQFLVAIKELIEDPARLLLQV